MRASLIQVERARGLAVRASSAGSILVFPTVVMSAPVIPCALLPFDVRIDVA